MKRSSYLERRWPDSPVFQEIAGRWCKDQSRLLLNLVWIAYDQLRENDLAQSPMAAADEAKEETLNLLMGLNIRKNMSGDEPFNLVHEVPEQTRRKRGPARSPQPDLGFVLYDYPRTVWPIEGKILEHERDVRAYVKEIKENLLTGRYATFSGEGAMLGYLFRGNPLIAFNCIAHQTKWTLRYHSRFPERNHRISEHRRKNLPHRNSPKSFCCHHLVLQIAE